ncbi:MULTISPECIES: ABC transporter substrate-binding protein [unclassified Corynebacterium]|uniref:ABC transporter substrate-binding protein n=1 Tax=unclassified Corynebacterium TaxID=2624378 RepID=UPI0008A43396|nr:MULTISPECIES: ABC transporter substrate-binding protein [unclassified Corynebacterium]OFN77740.1 ABC transporter substrate-binding protein [Corynebacterium sp. HMSC074E01]OHO61924.1 ABC transporter substrate-binding protein [Corynebacterium sp. HMSC036D02]
MIKKTGIVGVVGALAATVLSGCVTNEEPALPEGWSEPNVEKVPEIAAMYEDADGVLTVGTNPPFAPFEFKDSDGSIIGLEMDLANAVAQVLGLEFQPVEQDFSMILPAVQSGQIDLGGSGFTDTEERRENFDFVDILYAGIQWAKLTDGPHEVDPSNPCGLTVAVQRTTVSETDDLRPKQEACDGNLTILPYDTSDNAALAVLMGRADALSADSPVSAWAVNRSDGRMSMVGEMFDAAPYGFAVPKDSDLGPAVAAALQHLIDTGAYAEILDKWGVNDGLVEHAMINERPIND